MKAQLTKTIDVNTNERVTKCVLPADFKEEMNKVLNKHQQKLNTFMMVSQQVADLQIKWIDLRKELNGTDEGFKAKMRYIAKKLKLVESDPWSYNMQEQCFELREPPDIQPLTAGQIEGALDEKG